jgi:hypothetical protein
MSQGFFTRQAARARDKRRLKLYSERACGSCVACCTAFAVKLEEGETVSYAWPESGEKPIGKKCDHLSPKTGCGVYSARPQACRKWDCIWRSGSDLVTTDESPMATGVVLDNPRDREKAHRLLFVREAYPGGLANAAEMLIRLSKDRVIAVVDDALNVVFVMGDMDEAKRLGVTT